MKIERGKSGEDLQSSLSFPLRLARKRRFQKERIRDGFGPRRLPRLSQDPGGGLGIRKIGSVSYFKAVFTATHRSGQQLRLCLCTAFPSKWGFSSTYYKVPSNLTGMQIKDQLPTVVNAPPLFSSSIKLAVNTARHIFKRNDFPLLRCACNYYFQKNKRTMPQHDVFSNFKTVLTIWTRLGALTFKSRKVSKKASGFHTRLHEYSIFFAGVCVGVPYNLGRGRNCGGRILPPLCPSLLLPPSPPYLTVCPKPATQLIIHSSFSAPSSPALSQGSSDGVWLSPTRIPARPGIKKTIPRPNQGHHFRQPVPIRLGKGQPGLSLQREWGPFLYLIVICFLFLRCPLDRESQTLF